MLIDSHKSGLAHHEQDNTKKNDDSDAERDLQERILQSAEQLGVDRLRVRASPPDRTHASASQRAEQCNKQKSTNGYLWPRQV